MKTFHKLIFGISFVLIMVLCPLFLVACGETPTLTLTLEHSFKTEYFVGDELDVAGGKLKYTQNNNSTIVDIEENMVSNFSTATAGSKEMTVSYNDLQIKIPYQVYNKSLTLEHSFNTEYLIGNELDVTGGKLRYTEKSSETIIDIKESMISGFSTDTAGTRHMTISYKGLQLTIPYTVREATSLSITWKNETLTKLNIAKNDVKEIIFDYTAPNGYSNSNITLNNGDIELWQKDNDSFALISDKQIIIENEKVTFDYGAVTKIILNNFNTSNMINMYGMFDGCSSLTTLDISKFDTSNVLFMDNMFHDCSSLTALDLSNFNTSNVINMDSMFYGCENLTTLNISNFNTSNVIDMESMFNYCLKLTKLDLSNFDTSKVTSMDSMFYGCESLTTLNISSFNTSSVTNMYSMFLSCSSLTTLDVTNFDTSNVTNMNFIFSYCANLTSLDVTNFNTSNVVDMSGMFYDCEHLTTLDLSNFDTAKVTNMREMFFNCKKLTKILVGENWIVNTQCNTTSMFNNCGCNDVTKKLN